MKTKICFLSIIFILCICAKTSFSDGLKTIQKTLIVLRPDYFSSEDSLQDLGTVQQKNGDALRILFNEHFWGNGRRSCRIVIIKNGMFKVCGKNIAANFNSSFSLCKKLAFCTCSRCNKLQTQTKLKFRKIEIFQNFNFYGMPIGAYGGISERPTVTCRGLEFPYNSNQGNIILLENGIPETVYLDGEHYRFEYF